MNKHVMVQGDQARVSFRRIGLMRRFWARFRTLQPIRIRSGHRLMVEAILSEMVHEMVWIFGLFTIPKMVES
jgi:hypothetical protein